MPTERQSQASRRNGAKSRGPLTEAGKAISSRNRYTHGMLSRTIVIEGEESIRFATLLHSLEDSLQPRNCVEQGLVEDLAICRWRQRRLLAMETACLSREIRHQDPASSAESPAIRAALALGSLASESTALDLIGRYENRVERQANRILRTLSILRKNDSGHSNPAAD